MNYVLMIGFVLAAGILNQSFVDREEQIRAEAVKRVDDQIAKCQAVQDQHARNLTTLLDRGGVLFVGGEPVTLCRRQS